MEKINIVFNSTIFVFPISIDGMFDSITNNRPVSPAQDNKTLQSSMTCYCEFDRVTICLALSLFVLAQPSDSVCTLNEKYIVRYEALSFPTTHA